MMSRARGGERKEREGKGKERKGKEGKGGKGKSQEGMKTVMKSETALIIEKGIAINYSIIFKVKSG